jgi:hypothetical protein
MGDSGGGGDPAVVFLLLARLAVLAKVKRGRA